MPYEQSRQEAKILFKVIDEADMPSLLGADAMMRPKEVQLHFVDGRLVYVWVSGLTLSRDGWVTKIGHTRTFDLDDEDWGQDDTWSSPPAWLRTLVQDYLTGEKLRAVTENQIMLRLHTAIFESGLNKNSAAILHRSNLVMEDNFRHVLAILSDLRFVIAEEI